MEKNLLLEYLQTFLNKKVYVTLEEGIEDEIKQKTVYGTLKNYLLDKSSQENSFIVLEMEHNPERLYIRERDIVVIAI